MVFCVILVSIVSVVTASDVDNVNSIVNDTFDVVGIVDNIDCVNDTIVDKSNDYINSFNDNSDYLVELDGVDYSLDDDLNGRRVYLFSDLANKVSNAPNDGVLNLNDGDVYKKTGNSQITITQSITIYGNGVLIDGNNYGGSIFSINSGVSKFYITNITFINCSRNAITSRASETVIEYCNFYNCQGQYGGAILYYSINVNINHCIFINCRSKILGGSSYAGSGGAIACYATNSIGYITNNIFINNTSEKYGGALFISDYNNQVVNVVNNVFLGSTSNKNNGIEGRLKAFVVYNNWWGSNSPSYVGGDTDYLKVGLNSITMTTLENGSTLVCFRIVFMSSINGKIIDVNLSRPVFYNGCVVENKTSDDNLYWIGEIDNYDYGTLYACIDNQNLVISKSSEVIDYSLTSLQSYINYYLSIKEYNINLTHNYSFIESKDFSTGVLIGNNLCIEGNDCIVDGLCKSRLFKIMGNNVSFSNLNCINANASYGGAFYIAGDNINLLDVNFINNSAFNGSAIYIIKSVNNWCNLNFINNTALNTATIYFKDDSTVFGDNLTFVDNIISNGLNIIGEKHIYAPVIYVDMTHTGFGIIEDEPASLGHAVNNILPNGNIILLSDYILEDPVEIKNSKNITIKNFKNQKITCEDKFLFVLLTMFIFFM